MWQWGIIIEQCWKKGCAGIIGQVMEEKCITGIE
jgi:hypothetical protein